MAVKPRQMPDPQAPIPEGSTVETVFEVRVKGDLGAPLRAVLTSAFIRTVMNVARRQALVIGRQEITTPPEETSS